MAAAALAHRFRNRLVRLAASRSPGPIGRTSNEILLIRPDHLGDVLLLQPALSLLKPRVHRDRLVLMTGPWSRDVARHALPVDEVIECPFPGFERSNERALLDPYRLLWHVAETVRRRAPRAAVILRDDHWWGAWMAQQAGIPARFGHDDELVRPHLTSSNRTRSRHWVQRNAELLASALAELGYDVPAIPQSPDELKLDWPISAEAAGSVNALLASLPAGSKYAVIHPGSGAPVKHWPVDRWAAVANQIIREYDLCVVITGGPSEQAITGALTRVIDGPVVNACGRTSIWELGELYRGAAIVLGVDSGPLHLAVATGSPTLHIYGPSDIDAYGPWGEPARHSVVRAGMICPRCGDLSPHRPEGCGCMVAVTVDRVLAETRRILRHD